MIRIKIKQPKSLLVLNALVLETGQTFFVIQIFPLLPKKEKKISLQGICLEKKSLK
jgi:hypothetical protein